MSTILQPCIRLTHLKTALSRNSAALLHISHENISFVPPQSEKALWIVLPEITLLQSLEISRLNCFWSNGMLLININTSQILLKCLMLKYFTSMNFKLCSCFSQHGTCLKWYSLKINKT